MKVTIEIPDSHHDLATYTDTHVAFLWHVSQHNPAPSGDEQAGQAAESVAREIIRRWLRTVTPELWRHQGKSHYWDILRNHGKWLPIDGDDTNRQWIPNTLPQ